MTHTELLQIVNGKAVQEFQKWTGRQGWEFNYIWSQWYDRLKWLIETPQGPVYKTSAEWYQDSVWVVADPDGWDRRNMEFSWHQELITWEEFQKRVAMSTVGGFK